MQKTYQITIEMKNSAPMVYTTKDRKEAVKFRAYYNARKKSPLLKIISVKMKATTD